jgi:polypeptide N-acetylgalactosaminyltransferase
MRRDELCLDYSKELRMYRCHGKKGNQHWKYYDETGFLIHVLSKACLTMDKRDTLSMEKCEERITQRWKFESYNQNIARKISL